MLNFKAPKLHKQSKEWVIEYELQHPETGEWHRFKKRKGLNKKGLTAAARKANASDAIAVLIERIKSGAENPWETIPETPTVTVKEALLKALQLKTPDVKDSTASEYGYSLIQFLAGCDTLGYSDLDITLFKRRHIVSVLDYLRANGKSDYRWNLIKSRISALLTVLVEVEIIDANPSFRAIKKKALPEATKFDPATDEEHQAINKHLYNNHRRLFVYKSLTYTVGVRPDEILSIKARQVNLKDGFIDIPPENTKVGLKGKRVPLIEDMQTLLTEHMKGCSPNDFVFSTGLKPGAKRITRQTASNYWRKAVKIELGINRNLYAEKARGTDDKILADIDLDFLRQVYGHSSKRMTERYASQLKPKAFEEIKKKSPGIIPK